MSDVFGGFLQDYGYLALLLLSAIDHTGTPGALLIGVGLSSSGMLQIWPALVVNFLGSLLGDVLIYLLGLLGGRPVVDRIAHRWPSIGRKADATYSWLRVHGSGVIIWGRFVALAGRYVSLVCGVARLPFWRFFLLSTIGCLAMTGIYGLVAVATAESVNRLLQNSMAATYFAVALVLVQLLLTWVIVRAYRWWRERG